MLGFGKKKNEDKSKGKKDKSDSTKETPEESTDDTPGDPKKTKNKSKLKKKKVISVKLIVIVFLVIATCIGAYFVYTLFFSSSSTDGNKSVYVKATLEHINLPEEMLEFSFDHFPELYAIMLTVNGEIIIIESEIARIETISQKYPDQIKISAKEKKIWEKTRDTLQKTFLKVEKPVKETYVLYRVNKAAGLAQIEARQASLTQLAKTALTPVQELTQTIKSTEIVPEGFFKGNIYKLKKKFL